MAKTESKELQVVIPAISEMSQLQNLPVAERIATLKSITSYVGADTKSLDHWIGKEMPVCGVVVHDATVAVEKINKETGEIERVYEPVDRVVFKLDGHEGVSAVSMSCTGFVKDFLIPAFGVGDWKDSEGNKIVVKLRVGQTTKGSNRTFNFQVV